MGSTRPPFQRLLLCLFPGVKLPGRESAHSLPANLARLRMRGGISLIFPHAFMAGIGKSLIFLPLLFCHLYDFVRTVYGYHKEYINYHILDQLVEHHLKSTVI